MPCNFSNYKRQQFVIQLHIILIDHQIESFLVEWAIRMHNYREEMFLLLIRLFHANSIMILSSLNMNPLTNTVTRLILLKTWLHPICECFTKFLNDLVASFLIVILLLFCYIPSGFRLPQLLTSWYKSWLEICFVFLMNIPFILDILIYIITILILHELPSYVHALSIILSYLYVPD